MRVEGTGRIPCDLALFGEKPGHEELMEGTPFVGRIGQELWAAMDRFCGLSRDDFYVSNVLKESNGKRDPKPAEIAAALPEFIEELERVQPRIVVTAGGIPTRALLGPVKLSDVHGIAHAVELCGREYTVFPIFHPAVGLANKGFLSVFAYDLQRLKEFLDAESIPDPGVCNLRIRRGGPSHMAGQCFWFRTPPLGAAGAKRGHQGASPESLEVLGRRYGAGTIVGLDTEGWPDCPWGLSFSPDGTHGYVIPATDRNGLDWFARWIAHKTPVMHNGMHDIPVLRAMGIELPERWHDTQVLAYHDMLRTGSGPMEAEAQNLGTLAYRELDMRLGELTDCNGVDFDTQIIPYTDEVMQYAGEDAIAVRRLFDVYERRGLTTYAPYQIDMGQVPLVELMIANGIPFDVDATTDFYMELLEKLEVVTADLRHRAARMGNRDFNPGSHPQVRELVTRKIGLRIRKRTRAGKASTNEKALSEHKDHPFVAKIQEYRELQKLRGTYVLPLLEELQ